MVAKVCSCCSREITSEEWEQLPRVGLMPDGDGGVIEMRNHDCGSTLAVAVTPEERIGCCKRCCRIEPLRAWQGLEVCVCCEYQLQQWRENTQAMIRAILQRAERRVA